MPTPALNFTFDMLAERAAAPFRGAGRYAHGFALGKLRHDPVFRVLLAPGVLPERLRLVDLGCGIGVLPALLDAAATTHRAGQAALVECVNIVQGDIRTAPQWRDLLRTLGFTVESVPMSQGTPFGNVLHLARRSTDPAC